MQLDYWTKVANDNLETKIFLLGKLPLVNNLPIADNEFYKI